MNGVHRFVRGLAAILYAICHMLLFVTPGFLLAFVLAALYSFGSGKRFRNYITLHTTWHGAFLTKILLWILDIRLTVAPIGAFPPLASYIVIANHRGIIDIPLVCAVLWDLRLNALRWILKRSIWWTPPGWAALLTRCGFVKRRKSASEEDLSSVTACGEGATEDGASTVIFPEGTRFRGASSGASVTHVSRPKLGGFEALKRTMPHASILSITFCWKGGAHRGLGRTTWQASDLVGQSLHIFVEVIPRAFVDASPDWLSLHWAAKDRVIDAIVSLDRV